MKTGKTRYKVIQCGKGLGIEGAYTEYVSEKVVLIRICTASKWVEYAGCGKGESNLSVSVESWGDSDCWAKVVFLGMKDWDVYSASGDKYGLLVTLTKDIY
jgi:hypothetical protein